MPWADTALGLVRTWAPTKGGWLHASVLCVFALPALWHVVHLGGIVATRIGHPMALEWMEGGLLYEAVRIQEGLPVYPDPEEGYVPFPYPIGYPLLLAALGWFGGVDYALARLVSFAATLTATGLLAREVYIHFEGSSLRWLAAALTAGAVAAGYPVVDAWYDLARVDTVAALFPVAAAVVVASESVSPRRAVFAGLLLAAGVLTKQSVAPLVAWVVLFALVRHRRRGALLAAAAAGALALAIGALQAATEGNYWFYTVTLLEEHQVHWARVREAHEALHAFAPYAVLLPPVAILLALRRRWAARSVLWFGLAAASWAFGVVSFGKVGGHSNNLIPAVWLILPAALLLLGDALRAGARTDLGWVLGWAGPGAISLLLFQQIYPEHEYAVSRATRDRAEALNGRLAALEGTVFAPSFPHLAFRNGGGVHQIHAQAHNDLRWAGRPFREPYRRYLARVAPSFVLLDGREATADVVRDRYVVFEHLDPRRFDTRTPIGWRAAPRLLLKKRTGRRRERVLFDFETTRTDGWTLHGLAFRGALGGRGREQGPIVGMQGKRLLNSYHRERGDGVLGSASSPTFVIDRSVLGLLVGGGFAPDLRVELVVGERVVRYALGNDTERLDEIAWDVSDLRGREASLRVIDESRSAWGHIMLDDVALYEPATSLP